MEHSRNNPNDLLQRLNKDYFAALELIFKQKSIFGEGMHKDDFIETIVEILGNSSATQARLLYDEINTENSKFITWNKFVDFVTISLEPKSEKTIELSEPHIKVCPHVKRETIVKVVLIESENHFCYALLGKYGCVGLYDGNMNFLTFYYVLMTREDVFKEDAQRRKKNRWITDAIFFEDILMFVVTSSARNLTIYDASGLNHVPLFLVLGVPNILQNMTYCSQSKKYILFTGDEKGNVLHFTFHQPKINLLRKKHNDKLSIYYWNELSTESEHIDIKTYKYHNSPIEKIQYFPDNDTLVSCSNDQDSSIVIRYMDNKIKPYIFKMKKGAGCFYLSRKLKILISGSADGILRVWNIVVTDEPISSISLHRNKIIDIVIMDNYNVFLSLCQNWMLVLWDLNNIIVLQKLELKFPPIREIGRNIEWGVTSIYPGPKRRQIIKNDSQSKVKDVVKNKIDIDMWEQSNILITCCNYIATINWVYPDSRDKNFNNYVLPPPPLQNSVLIPSSWNVGNLDIETNGRTERDSNFKERVEHLSFILEKDLVNEYKMSSDINVKIAKLEEQKQQMQDIVSKGAPYLAMNLQDVEEITLSPNLPAPNSKKSQAIVEKFKRLLSDANSKSLIFSEPLSSSRSRSSRSSIIEFDYIL